MKVYCTTRNDPKTIVYFGTSVKKAEDAVPEPFCNSPLLMGKEIVNFADLYCPIPKDNVEEWELIQFFAVDAWWYSIVMIELKEET